MSLQLSTFEQSIDEKILERGIDLFAKEKVTLLRSGRAGKILAEVIGSRPYQVEVALQGDTITNYHCDCPYDWGGPCKHTVALLFQLSMSDLGGLQEVAKVKKKAEKRAKDADPDATPVTGRKKAAPKKSPNQILEELVRETTETEIKEFLLTQMIQDSYLADRFKAEYLIVDSIPTLRMYAQGLRRLFKRYKLRGGYYTVYDAQGICTALQSDVKRLSLLESTGRVEESYFRSSALIDELYKVYLKTDEGDGLLEVISDAIESMLSSIDQITEKKVYQHAVRFMLKLINSGSICGWVVEGPILNKLLGVKLTSKQSTDLEASLEGQMHLFSDDELRISALIQLKRKAGGAKAVSAFLEEHKHDDAVVRYLINQAIRSQDYSMARKLAHGARDMLVETDFHGLYEWVLITKKIALAADAKKDIITSCEWLICYGPPMDRKENLDLIESRMSKKKFKDLVDKAIREVIDTLDRGPAQHCRLDLLIKTDRWEDVKQVYWDNLSFRTIMNAKLMLSERLPAELPLYLAKIIENELERGYIDYNQYHYFAEMMFELREAASESAYERVYNKVKAVHGNKPTLMERIGS